MRRLGDADLARSVEEALERDLRLDACQRTSRAGVDPAAERDVLAKVRSIEPQLVGASKRPGSRFTACGKITTVAPAGMSTPASVVRTRAMRGTVLTGPFRRSTSSMKSGRRFARAGGTPGSRDRRRGAERLVAREAWPAADEDKVR